MNRLARYQFTPASGCWAVTYRGKYTGIVTATGAHSWRHPERQMEMWAAFQRFMEKSARYRELVAAA